MASNYDSQSAITFVTLLPPSQPPLSCYYPLTLSLLSPFILNFKQSCKKGSKVLKSHPSLCLSFLHSSLLDDYDIYCFCPRYIGQAGPALGMQARTCKSFLQLQQFTTISNRRGLLAGLKGPLASCQ